MSLALTYGPPGAGKLAAPETLRESSESHSLPSPVPGRESLEIDDAPLARAEVAGPIVSHYHLPTTRAD